MLRSHDEPPLHDRIPQLEQDGDEGRLASTHYQSPELREELPTQEPTMSGGISGGFSDGERVHVVPGSNGARTRAGSIGNSAHASIRPW